jgi:hypothetical protein
MNQRFQNAEIRRVSEQYAENELYRAVSTIGQQLESETEFGLCSEECFMEALGLLSEIADKGEKYLSEIDNYWLHKFNEYRRFDRHLKEEEIRKAVGIVFAFVILALDSSRHPFYRYTLTRRLTQIVASHQFKDWTPTFDRIFSVPLPDGWFDSFIDEESEEPNSIKLPKELDTSRARIYFKKAMEKDWLRLENDRYRWIGTNDKGNTSELAYFLGRVYNYKHTFNGNDGEDFPEESLNKLFYAKRLYSSLTQVYNAKKPQRWRSQIDTIFD